MPKRTGPVDVLVAARDAIVAGDAAAALAQLAIAWVAVPSPRIAALTPILARRITPQKLPTKVADREAAWLALAATREPTALPTLLGVDWPVHPRAAKVRLAALLAFAPDPQIAEALVGLLRAKRYESNAGVTFWRNAQKTLGLWGERRLGTRQEPLLAPAFEQALEAVEAAVAATIGTRTSATSRDALFAAVYDDPASDAPRSVLADALLADEDPRGELIQLQLAGKGGKAAARARALIRAHGATWLDGLGDRVVSPIFRRGFVAEVGVAGTPRNLELRAWSTVEHLRFVMPPTGGGELATVLAHPNLAGLRGVLNVTADQLAGVTRALDLLHLLTPGGALPAALRVRTLSIAGSDPMFNEGVRRPLAALLAWFDTTNTGARTLILDRGEADLADAFHWFQDRDLDALVLSPSFGIGQITAWELALGRATTGTTLVATWHGRQYDERDASELGRAIGRLPPNALASFVARSAVDLEPARRERLIDELAPGLVGKSRTAPVVFA